jgi:F-type H+-transporting ATPase subunit delta
MAERRTAARPYAEAVFRLASDDKRLKEWSEMLAFAAAVASDARVIAVANDPRLPRADIAKLFLDIAGKRLDAKGANFIRVLAENRRLTLLPEIAGLYEEFKNAAESRIEATATAAFELSAAEVAKIEQALKRRLGRDVRVTASVDKSLLGGVVIRAGDVVIDGSVRGRLGELANYLIH